MFSAPTGEEDDEEGESTRVNGYSIADNPSPVGNHVNNIENNRHSGKVQNGGYEKTNGYNGYGSQVPFNKGRRISTDGNGTNGGYNRGGPRSFNNNSNKDNNNRRNKDESGTNNSAGQTTTITTVGPNNAPHNDRLPPRQHHHHHHQQSKIIFNGDDYTRITTPRQDGYYKKTYSSQRKHWTPSSTASTSATPSTAESQSASHSTAGEHYFIYIPKIWETLHLQ